MIKSITDQPLIKTALQNVGLTIGRRYYPCIMQDQVARPNIAVKRGPIEKASSTILAAAGLAHMHWNSDSPRKYVLQPRLG